MKFDQIIKVNSIIFHLYLFTKCAYETGPCDFDKLMSNEKYI